jgi:hypothetical protein
MFLFEGRRNQVLGEEISRIKGKKVPIGWKEETGLRRGNVKI